MLLTVRNKCELVSYAYGVRFNLVDLGLVEGSLDVYTCSR